MQFDAPTPTMGSLPVPNDADQQKLQQMQLMQAQLQALHTSNVGGLQGGQSPHLMPMQGVVMSPVQGTPGMQGLGLQQSPEQMQQMQHMQMMQQQMYQQQMQQMQQGGKAAGQPPQGGTTDVERPRKELSENKKVRAACVSV